METQSKSAGRPTTVPWPPILLAGAVAGAIVLGYWAPLPWPGVNDLAARVLGLGFGAAGLLFMAWGIITLHREQTNILPNKGADKLVTSGAFARFRNPIYLGDALLLLGVAEVTHNVWFAIMSVVFAVLVTVLSILPEERHLEHKFGESYRAYKDRTRRWI